MQFGCLQDVYDIESEKIGVTGAQLRRPGNIESHSSAVEGQMKGTACRKNGDRTI